MNRPLTEQFGDIDIYLFDQLLRGRVENGWRVLDAGCGHGRNLVYLLQHGWEVFGADEDPGAVEAVRALAKRLAPHLPQANFHMEPVDAMTFPEQSMQMVISSAVLHFARDHSHFRAMLEGSWRPLAPGGLFFCRLASSIGMEDRVTPIAGGRYGLPDGSERYLVNESMLMELTDELGGELLDPIKTTVVQDRRAMTTWVMRRE